MVTWRKEAANDLKRIRAYVQKHDLGAARRIAQEIRKAVRLLEGQPGIGRAGRVVGTREWPGVPPYILIYRVRNDVLEIVRVLHGAQKWPVDDDE